jgi:hypothetical protein
MDTSTPILAKPQQIERERTAIRLLARPEVEAQVARARELFAASPIAQSESARSTIEPAVDNLAFQACLYAANFDTVDPFILWGTNAAHSWFGLDVPASGYGLDAPDNTYRHATLDGSARYRIRGELVGTGPSQQTFVVYRTIPGVTQTMNAEGHMDEVAGIKSEALVRDADGGFTITVDADPADGRDNHLQVDADLDGLHLMIRDSMADWDVELPVELSIERLDPPAGHEPKGDDEMAEHAASIMASYVPYWINWYETYLGGKPLNEVPQPWMRVQGWGMTQQGRFELAPDQAWVLTFDPLDAAFFDLQISDPWSRTVRYVDRTGSFNANQAERNADGTLTLVLAATDPGVHNWLDSESLSVGTFQVRWQSLPEGSTGEGAVRSVELVPIAELEARLPEGTRFVTPAERAEQQRVRAESYARRLR